MANASVPMFIATAQGGRRVMSCDDGLTWKVNCRTEGFPDGACLVNASNGDHEEWSSHRQGIAYGEGVFLVLYGWFGGEGAHVLRTRDGRVWDHVFGALNGAKGTWGTGIAFGNGVFAVNAQRSETHRTTDNGDTWKSTTFSEEDRPHRRSMMFIPYGKGRFLSYGDASRMTYSDDGGITWTDTTTSGCGYLGSFAWGNGRLVAKSFEGACVSTDGGKSWTSSTQWFGPGTITWTGSVFYVSLAYQGYALRSSDGVDWSRVAVKKPEGSTWPAIVAVSDQGTMVGLDEEGGAYFRSTDGGVTWTGVSGPAGTRFTQVLFGRGAASVDCPR